MTATVEQIAKSVRESKDTSEVFPEIDAWGAQGRAGDLVTLWRSVDDAAVREHVEEIVSLTAGDAFVDAAFTLARENPSALRAIASHLGHGHTKEAFSAAAARFARDEHLELLACWMHEMVLRGVRLDAEPAAKAVQSKLSGHPLGALPLALVAAEREAPTYMPLYGEQAIQRAVSTLESCVASARTIPPPGERTPPTVSRVEGSGLEPRLLEAFETWVESPNGKAEAHVFALSPGVDLPLVGRWLVRALPIASLRGATSADIQRVEVDVVWGALFAAAANGGAASRGLGGAYGRRAAWSSLGALVDAARDAPIAHIDARAKDAAFLLFNAPGPWFHDVAWDVGVAALRPDGGTIAVVAATDADG